MSQSKPTTYQSEPQDLCRLLFETALDGLLVLQDNQIIDCNASAAALFGCSQAELLDQTLAKFCPAMSPHDADSVQGLQTALAAALSGEGQRFEWQFETITDELFWAEVTLNRVELEAETLIQVSLRDITAYKLKEEALQKSSERFQRLSEASFEAVVMTDKGQVIDANDQFVQMFGYELTEAIGMDTWNFIAPESLELVKERDLAGYDQPYEAFHRRKDGTTFPALVSGKSISYQGHTLRVTALRDITKRKLVEQELARFREILESTSDFVGIADVEANVVYINQAGREMMGFKPNEDITTTKISDYYPERERLMIENEVLPLTLRDGIWQGEATLLNRAGQEIPLSQVRVAHKSQQGEVIYLSMIGRDMSKQKQLEAQIQALLSRRERQVQTSTEIAQRIAAAPTLTELFEQVVNLVQDRFAYGHVQIYIVEGQSLVMQAGSGQVGQALKARNHKIELTREDSLVIQAAQTGDAVLAPDVKQTSNWLPNPLLPDTKAEIAVPIKLGNRLLGVLDVQDDTVDGLTEEDQLLLLGLGGQIAIAMESTRLFEEANIFRHFAEVSGQGLGMATLEGQVTYINPALAHMLDEDDPIKAVGKPMFTYYNAESQQRIRDEIFPLILQGEQWVGELTLQTITGREIPIVENLFLMYDETQRPVSIATAITDIRQVKQAEAELEARIQELDHLQRLMSREGWQAFQTSRTETTQGYLFDQAVLQPIVDDWDPLESGSVKLGETSQPVTKEVSVYGETVGGLGVYEEPDQPLTAEDQQFLGAVTEQVAAALQNARMFQQTQQALAEAEILYHIGTQLSRITNIDQVLQVVALPEIAPDVGSVALLHFDTDIDEQPEWVELMATSVYDQSSNDVLSMAVGARFYLSEFPLAKLWVANPRDVVLISDIAHNETLDEELRTVCEQAQAQAIAILPLTVGSRWIGSISLLWTTPYRFTERDERLYLSIASQTAVVVNNWMLLRQAETRATQLERLAQTEAELSQAGSEAEILTAVASNFELRPSDDLVLEYISTDEQSGAPISCQAVAVWHDGAPQSHAAILNRSYKLEDIPLAKLWLDAPSQPLIISDVETDNRVDLAIRELAQQRDFRTVVILPLYIGGRWLGVVSLVGSDPRTYSVDEQFILQGLLEPLAAVIASRRAYLAQQAALAETEALYNASRRLNEAGDLQSLLGVVAELGTVPIINRIELFAFEYNNEDEVEAMSVIANWHSGQGTPPSPVGRRYSQQQLLTMEVMLSPEPIIINDIQHDERVKAPIVARQQNTRAVIFMPFWVGGRQTGTLSLQGEEAYNFSEEEIKLYLSLAPQIAAAIQNQRLLTESQAALKEVEATQRRYTVQAWEDYQREHQVQRFEQVREGEVPLGDELPVVIEQLLAKDEGALSVAIPAQTDLQGQNGQEESLALDRSISKTTASDIIVPLAIRDEIIGVLGLQETKGDREWLPEELALIEAVAREMAQAAENLRLLDETQQRAAREKRVNEIGDKIQGAQTLDEALQIAVREVGLSLKTPETTVRLDVK